MFKHQEILFLKLYRWKKSDCKPTNMGLKKFAQSESE
jgi:hypothetical protein